VPLWTAEHTVDEALARELIGEQFPELPLEELRLVGTGWDNTVWLADGQWVFRFPRRQIAIPGFERELTVLPRIAPSLPVSIPVPTYIGRPDSGYPWPFFGARFIQGREVDGDLDDDARVRLARVVGELLRALHGLDVDGAELPDDPNRRADMPYRVARAEEGVEEVRRLGLWRPPRSVARTFAEARVLPPSASSSLTHGDLHFRHLLVDADGALTGVIDWGDVCRADPAVDLSIVWSLFSPAGRAELLAAYGPVPEERLLRARVLAFSLGTALAAYAADVGLERVAREAVAGLERAADDRLSPAA
jgi:aminoglycoside phosphotransferase (APT) family kinase protein